MRSTRLTASLSTSHGAGSDSVIFSYGRLGGEHKACGVALYTPRRRIQGRLGEEHKAHGFALYTPQRKTRMIGENPSRRVGLMGSTRLAASLSTPHGAGSDSVIFS
jgi:hypothetical protein